MANKGSVVITLRDVPWRETQDPDVLVRFYETRRGQVLKHRVTKKKTHPFDVHEILVHDHPGLEPGYTLV